METSELLPVETEAPEVVEQEEIIVEIPEQEEIVIAETEIIEPVEVLPEYSETIVTDISELLSDETTSDTEITTTTYNYVSEIASNTARTAECTSYLAGFTVIASSIFVCWVILKVFFGGQAY